MRKLKSTYPLRLPTSMKAEVARRAKADGTSFNQFVATAGAEKLAAMNTAALFLKHREYPVRPVKFTDEFSGATQIRKKMKSEPK